jgi:hypothetical protein
LSATIEWIKNGIARASIQGELRMTHQFYPGRADDNVVDATAVGYLDFETATKRVRSMRLVTDRATYGTGKLEVVVRSVP